MATAKFTGCSAPSEPPSLSEDEIIRAVARRIGALNAGAVGVTADWDLDLVVAGGRAMTGVEREPLELILTAALVTVALFTVAVLVLL